MSNDKSLYCAHSGEIKKIKPKTDGCEDCLKSGDEWVHLRQCQICGKVGCCDNSKNKHASGHYKETGHKIVQSFEPDERWYWCYEDELGFQYFK